MAILKNPFTRQSDFNCFGCSPDNGNGLHLNFTIEDDSVVCEWQPEEHFEGWKGVVHGGITATIMDEIAGWYIFSVLGVACMTMNMNIRYEKPLYSRMGKIKAVAVCIEKNRRIATIRVDIYNADGSLAATGELKYYCFTEEESKQKMNFPGKEAFL